MNDDNNEDITQQAHSLVDVALKLKLAAMLPNDFLKFLLEVDVNPTLEKIEQLHRWNEDALVSLRRRVGLPAQSSPDFVQGHQFLN